ncbi:MAG TPA: ATPase, T2SS/T4P/T4SS family [Ilumatobacteraceae bacterium]|nr:ATPase, T2SS/T4P/T4SS family [Ilumatobacteraceae bacterium]
MLPLAAPATVDALAAEATAHLDGLGPLQRLFDDPAVDEVMVNGGGEVWIDRAGALTSIGRLQTGVVERIIERVLDPLGRRLDRLTPMVDARLGNGSRVCAVVTPVAVDGTCLSVRRFSVRPRALTDFASESVADLLREAIERRCNTIVEGPTSSGKTSLLNTLAGCVGGNERIVTLEDTAELRLAAPHVLRLEARPPSADGAPPVTLADLVRTALRLRPDRLVVGEIRGAEVVDLLQALNTGHDGSLSTCHANSPADALTRLHSLVVQHHAGWPLAAVRDHIRRCVDLVVHVARGADGARRVVTVAEPQVGTDEMRVLVQDGNVVAPITRGRR